MNLQRGDIVLLDYPFSSGDGRKLRPGLVVQCDSNNVRLKNSIVAMITGTTHRAAEPTQLLIEVDTSAGRQSGLVFDSAVTCSNIFTVEQTLIQGKIGTLTSSLMQQINDCLRSALEL